MKKSTLNRILSLVLAMTMSLTLCIPAFAMPISASMPTYEGTMKNIQGQMKEQDAMYDVPATILRPQPFAQVRFEYHY